MSALTLLLLATGFILLIKGADLFVEASSSIAKRLRIPSIIIGLTIVAFGTSSPELAVSVSAALSGSNDIAIGNVIGSNIFNLLVVLGACAVIRPFAVSLRWDYAAAIGAAVILLLLFLFDGGISRIDGLLLILLFCGFIAVSIRDALRNRTPVDQNYELLSPLKSALFIIIGLCAIIFGGNLVVDAATTIAAAFGLSENLIGLTVVAVGTSLPELVTSVVAARKGENGIALGNVVGSNIFNIVAVLGLSAAIHPLSVGSQSVVDAICLIVFSIITFFLCRSKHRIGRLEGALMLLLYVAYLGYIIMR